MMKKDEDEGDEQLHAEGLARGERRVDGGHAQREAAGGILDALGRQALRRGKVKGQRGSLFDEVKYCVRIISLLLMIFKIII